MPKSHFQSEFSMSRTIRIFDTYNVPFMFQIWLVLIPLMNIVLSWPIWITLILNIDGGTFLPDRRIKIVGWIWEMPLKWEICRIISWIQMNGVNPLDKITKRIIWFMDTHSRKEGKICAQRNEIVWPEFKFPAKIDFFSSASHQLMM